MAIFAKLKGGKAADKAAAEEAAKQAEQDRPEVKRTWTMDDMRQIHRSASMPRINSETSIRSPERKRLSRSSTSISQDWNMPRHRSSLRSHSRGSSYNSNSLAQVMEDGQSIPPVPQVPLRYSQSSLSFSRPTSSRSPYSNASSMRRSPLSTAETTPADSEESSASSTKSDDVLEMRSHPYSRQEQYVFRPTQIVDGNGKGKAPMSPIGQTSTTNDEGSNSSPASSPKKKSVGRYFSKSTSNGSPDHSRPSTTGSVPGSPKEAQSPSPKKKRFSFLNKKGDTAVAAH